MKFSIILPTYNRAGTYLKGAIDSIVSQSYDNWELLIIDNHSEDFTDELIDNYLKHITTLHGFKLCQLLLYNIVNSHKNNHNIENYIPIDDIKKICD